MSTSEIIRAAVTPDHLKSYIQLPDGSRIGPAEAASSVHIKNDSAIAGILRAPRELGFVRGYVTGDIDINGDLYHFLEHRSDFQRAINVRRLALAAHRLPVAALKSRGRPDAEAQTSSALVSPLRRAREAISHHYDLPAEFFELFLGETMAYTCAVYESEEDSLDKAQHRKHDLICQKLALNPGDRLLDIGCGWGGFLTHAATQYDITAVGVTISATQAAAARKRIEQDGLQDRVEIRLQDYRDIETSERFDAISAIGVFEHIGLSGRGPTFFDDIRALMRPKARLLNHAVSRRHGEERGLNKRGFISRYVFPGGSAIEVGDTVSAIQAAGLEVHDVESLRNHYGPTLRAWVHNLDENWDEAEKIVGPERARVWRLFMSTYAIEMERFGIQHHQTLAVDPDLDGNNGMPWRRTWS